MIKVGGRNAEFAGFGAAENTLGGGLELDSTTDGGLGLGWALIGLMSWRGTDDVASSAIAFAPFPLMFWTALEGLSALGAPAFGRDFVVVLFLAPNAATDESDKLVNPSCEAGMVEDPKEQCSWFSIDLDGCLNRGDQSPARLVLG